MIYRIILVSIFFISILLFFSIPEAIDKIFLTLVISLALFSFYAYYKIIKSKFGYFPWLSIGSLFVIGHLIVSFQLYLTYIFGFDLNKVFDFFIWADKDIVNKAAVISLVGSVSFFCGNSFFFFKPKNLKKKTFNYKLSINTLFVFALIFYILFIFQSGSYALGFYSAGDQGQYFSYFNNGFNIFLKAALILKLYYVNNNYKSFIVTSIYDYIKLIGIPISFLVFWHIIFSIYVGDRGPVLTYTLLYFSIYFLKFYKISFIKFIVMVLLLSTVFSIMRNARTREDSRSYYERLSNIEINKNNFFDDEYVLLPLTIDLALSARNLHHSISNVPSQHDFMYGQYQILQIFSGIPFLGSWYHNQFLGGEFRYQGSAFFLTYLVLGDDAKSGEGSTATSDLYLDFGIPGVIFGFLIFGLITRRLDNSLLFSFENNFFIWIAALCYLSSAVYIARSAILFQIQQIIPIYIVILFFVNFFKTSKN